MGRNLSLSLELFQSTDCYAEKQSDAKGRKKDHSLGFIYFISQDTSPETQV